MKKQISPILIITLLVSFLKVNAKELKLVPDNAALVYWQAFSTMPTLTEKEQEALKELDKPTAEQREIQKKIISQSNLSVNLVKEFSDVNECDWGITYKEGWLATMPHISKCRQLAHIILLHVIHTKDVKEKEKLLLALVRLSKHTTDGTIISTLVGWAILDMVIDYIDKPHKNLLTEIKKVDTKKQFKESLIVEKKITKLTINKIDNDANHSLRKEFPLQVKLSNLLPEYEALFDELIVSSELDNDELLNKAEAIETKVSKSKNIIVNKLMPTVKGIVRHKIKIENRIKELKL